MCGPGREARIALSVVLFAVGEDVRSIEILHEGLDEIAEVDPRVWRSGWKAIS